MTLLDLERQLGIEFKDKKLISQAFIHRSYLNEDKKVSQSNERPEFLGDAVLSFLTSDFLYKTYPNFPEGVLTNIRSGLVKTKTLADAAKALNLGSLLKLSRGEEESGGRNNPSLLADCFEALLGTMYLDLGIDTCRKFLNDKLFPLTKTIVDQKLYIDFKSHLQEVVQEKIKASPIYKVVKSEGPDHAKTFWVEVESNGEILGLGQGKSKQEAEQQAASNALEKIGKK